MKRIISLILCIALFMTGCTTGEPIQQQSPVQETETYTISEYTIPDTTEDVTDATQPLDEVVIPDFTSLDDNELLGYMENEIYAELLQSLDPEQYYVEGVSTTYVSKEYLEELEYNSQSNIFFGYTLDELDAMFNGKRYVFTLDENGQTTVEELVALEDNTYDKVIKNVAIGSGVILVTVTVAIITKNPAASATAGKTVKLVFTASSMGAKAGTIMAFQSAGIGGASAAIVEAIRTGDPEMILKAGLLGGSEGFKFGAIFGTAKGIADGIRVVGNSRYFPSGSEQAAKYPEGVEFTAGPNGVKYPRFEKWAKATAKFDAPTVETAMNHTGLSGNYYWDAKLANAQCGFSQTPSGYVWHHVEDMQTMILIPQDLHSVAMGGMSHTGGASLIRALLGI